MIYLIQSPSYADETRKTYKDILKIGYTADESAEKRFCLYKNHNPSRVVLFTIPGATLQDESNLHAYFSRYRISGREWYEYSDEIIEFFKTHTTVESLAVLPPYRNRDAEAQARKEEKKRLFAALTKDEKLLYSKLKGMSAYNRLKYICEEIDSGNDMILPSLKKIPSTTFNTYAKYVEKLGTGNLKRLAYHITSINKELKMLTFDIEPLKADIYTTFKVGDRLKYCDVKKTLKDLYKKHNYYRSAKAKDIEEWFETKDAYFLDTLPDGTKKKSMGYELLSKKPRDAE